MTSHKLSSRWVGFAFGVAGVTGYALLPSVAAAGRPDTRFESMDDNDDGKISPTSTSPPRAGCSRRWTPTPTAT